MYGIQVKAILFPGSTHHVPSHFCPHGAPLWGMFTPQHPTGVAKTVPVSRQRHSLPPSAFFHLSFYTCQTLIWSEGIPYPMLLSLPLCLSQPSSQCEPLACLTPSQCLPPGNPEPAPGSVIILSLEIETPRCRFAQSHPVMEPDVKLRTV